MVRALYPGTKLPRQALGATGPFYSIHTEGLFGAPARVGDLKIITINQPDCHLQSDFGLA
jgi:hypothetical protein